jgi:electron transfer flavoprotein beta subunit
MKILVCITHVPDTISKISFTDNNTKLNTQGVQFIVGPYDDYALARAVELRESGKATHITVLNVGTAETDPTLRKALAIGADDAVRIDTAPLDSFQVAELIANYAKANAYDLILMGRESIDFNSGLVHGIVGELLGWPSVSPVMKMEFEGNLATMAKEVEGGKEYVELNLPFVAGCQEPIAEWKIPSMRGIMSARTKPLTVVAAEQATEKTHVAEYTMPAAKGSIRMVPADMAAELMNLLHNEAKVI